jgi:hypothetical protein
MTSSLNRALAAALPLAALPLAALLAAAAPAQEARHLCTGIGLEREEEAARFPHSLRLVFAETGGSYIADVAATVSRGGETLLSATCPGPWLLVDLPEGRYAVTATYGGETKRATVSVPAGGTREFTFAF